MHRNVIFRDERVTERPITIYDTGQSVASLWRALDDQCRHGQMVAMCSLFHTTAISQGVDVPEP